MFIASKLNIFFTGTVSERMDNHDSYSTMEYFIYYDEFSHQQQLQKTKRTSTDKKKKSKKKKINKTIDIVQRRTFTRMKFIEAIARMYTTLRF